METITVLEGRLETTPAASPNPQQQHHTEATHIFINGFQSWSFAGSLVKGHAQPQSAMPNVLSRAFNAGGSVPPPATSDRTYASSSGTIRSPTTNPPPPVHYTSDFFTCLTSDSAAAQPRRFLPPREAAFPFTRLDERGGPALILGWLSQREQFGVVTADRDLQHLSMHASAHGQVVLPGRSLVTDWAHAQLLAPHSYDEEPLVHFFHAVAAYNQARPLQNGNLLVGWCSWYHYYENISEATLRENFAKLSGLKTKVPMNVSVVDDGYMTAWGDWDSLKPGKFTTMENVSRDIRSNEMRPGLWLAPFAADKHSTLTRKHPDWVIQNDRGVAANSSNCGKFFYGLDATNPAVREHVFKSIQRAVVDWKFNVLKIDFLYAACLEGNGKYDLSMSRAQAMHVALDTIRQAAGPNTFLIGCGCPLATAVGYVDGMRVSADTGPTWYPALPLPWWDHGTLPCLRSMIRNSMSRAAMGHRWWHNDPDCLLLGESTRLTQEEVASAASVVAMTCGMMLLSDDLTKVTLSRMRILTKIFPMTGATAVVLDLHSTNDGLPSLLRLWATDCYSERLDTFRNEAHLKPAEDSVSNLAHMEATFLARQASFQIDSETPPPNERKRSCIHVCQGLGTWTIVSISNWTDKSAVLHLPPPALLPPPPTVFEENEADTFLEDPCHIHQAACGYHAFGFWSSRYTWLPPQAGHESLDEAADHPLLSRRLAPHETEIYHIKPVTAERPQYIGSDLHFSCGQEVLSFVVREDTACVELQLNPAYHRVGHVFLYLPRISTERVRVTVNGNQPGSWTAVGNTPKVCTNGSPRLVGRVICIPVAVQAEGSPHDGQIQVQY
jgi:alpha-galactosidase